jgi:hypothetical protein
MSYPLFVPGLEHHDIEIQPSGFVRGPRLLLDGRPAPRGPKRHQYVLTRKDGSKTVVHLKPTLLDTVPKVIVDGEQIEIIEPLSPVQLIWSGLPLIMLFIGGAIGGLLGGAAAWTNVIVFRSEMNPGEKYILTALISGLAVVLFLIASVIFSRVFSGMDTTSLPILYV